ncbi:MAG TPA: rod shape-determining protein RodA [Sphingomicrobium sp.]|nr:rod shape-determining protein RodA [Sphingomicrobium sp.]
MITSAIIPRPLARLPWRLIFLVAAIAGFGLLVLYSTAGASLQPWALKQALIFTFFLSIAIGMSWLRESTIKAFVFPAYVVIVLMLVAVDVLGFAAKGAQRWLDLGPISLQPSEFMKPAIVLTLARFYELLPAAEVRKWRGMWPALVMLGVPAFLILVQPDLGTCIMVVLCGVTVMFLAGLPWWLFVAPAVTIAVAAPIAYSMLHGYQRKRIDVFLNPESDPLGAGYHIAQSKIAIGSGGLWGKGFLNGSQSHLDYLPEGHTDFAFAALAEEWGLVGGIVLILAFGAVIRWGMWVASNGRTRFAQLSAAGLTACIFFYASINLMMVMGLAPVVGVPLPLISYGGSAVMTVMLCLGLLMAFERQQRTVSTLA